MLIVSLIFLAIFSFLLSSRLNKERVELTRSGYKRSSLNAHYIYSFIIWSILLIMIVIFSSFSNFEKYLSLFFLIFTNFLLISYFFKQGFNAKAHLESIFGVSLFLTAAIGIIITFAITLSIVFESIRFFEMVHVKEFIFGLKWNPQMAMHSEQSVSESAFGMVPVMMGTLLITFIAIAISLPIGIMAAIYLSFYVKSKTRDLLKPLIEILAGVPTVVYGYFAVIAISPIFKEIFSYFSIDIAAESALAAGFVMGIMIIPFVLSLTDDALNSVPGHLKDSALALGSTKSEMIRKVVLIAAAPNIAGAAILAFSRAIGETMIVAMAAGLVAKLSFNPLDSVTTATAQIVSLLIGDQEFNSPKTLAAFALALVLFIITFAFNILALVVVRKYKRY